MQEALQANDEFKVIARVMGHGGYAAWRQLCAPGLGRAREGHHCGARSDQKGCSLRSPVFGDNSRLAVASDASHTDTVSVGGGKIMGGWRRVARLVLTTLVLVVLPTLPVSAQSSDDLDTLRRRAQQLYKAGKYAEAIPLAERHVEALGVRSGRDNLEYATALNNLAQLNKAAHRFAEAEPQMRRAIAVFEKFVGPASQRGHSGEQPSRRVSGTGPVRRG